MSMRDVLEMVSNRLHGIDVDIFRVLQFTPELMHFFAHGTV